jgi:hypothetical protein
MSPGSPCSKPHLPPVRVAPNPSQTTLNNPRNFFQASDPGARLGADIPFLQTLLVAEFLFSVEVGRTNSGALQSW